MSTTRAIGSFFANNPFVTVPGQQTRAAPPGAAAPAGQTAGSGAARPPHAPSPWAQYVNPANSYQNRAANYDPHRCAACCHGNSFPSMAYRGWQSYPMMYDAMPMLGLMSIFSSVAFLAFIFSW